MKNSLYNRIEKKIHDFPSLPTAVAEVMKVTNNPESSAKDLTQAILPDQSMCVAILKIANSVLYGRPKKVSSLETAIMVLGFDEIQNIVLSKSVISSFGGIFKKNNAAIIDFWDHSFTCALAARVIADHLNLSSPGQFFIGGLIHDIGKLAMFLTFPEEYPTEKWLTGFSDTERLEMERAEFSITHDEVGSRLLRKWNFPEHLLTAIEFHHSPKKATKYIGFPSLIQLADALAFLCCNPEEIGDLDMKLAIKKLLPAIEEQWTSQELPWGEIRLEAWFNWIQIDREHGSSILSILAY